MKPLSSKFVFWAPAPNRHNHPFLDEAFARGILRKAYYSSPKLGWEQLGGRPRIREYEEVLEDRADVHRVLAGWPGVDHVINGFARGLCRRAMRAATKARSRWFVLCESPQPRHRGSPISWGRSIGYAWLLRGASGAFAMSREAALALASYGVPKDRIWPSIYCGPEPTTGGGTPRRGVVFCGRLLPRKGVDVLLEALTLLRAEGLPVETTVIGSGTAESALVASAARTNTSVRFVGAAESNAIQAALARAQVLVVPSRWWEGWGYVVNEAIAAGCPVLVSSIVGAREIVVPGRTGHVFEADDARSLARALHPTMALSSLPECRRDIHLMQAAVSAKAFVEYVDACLCREARAPPIEPPWLRLADQLGGSPHREWWRSWNGV